MSVRRAQSEIDSREFTEWMAYRRIRHDPDDVRAARICNVMARLQGNKHCTLEDFLPRLPVARQSGQAIKAMFQAISAAQKRAKGGSNAGKDRRRNRR